MQRYFIPEDQWSTSEVVLAGEDARHALKVMRSRVGDVFIACNGKDRDVLAKISQIDERSVRAQIMEELPLTGEAEVQVWIAQSLPKGDKLELVIQKCTELGAARFIPFESMRTIVQYDAKKEAKRMERWHKIAKEAAEQSHRSRIPQVDAPLSWKQLLASVSKVGKAWICYEKETARGLKQALLATKANILANDIMPSPLLIIVGPEGGFTEQEIAEAETAGCECISLGQRILRTETAAMAGLTAILYEFDEIGGDKKCQL